MKIITQIFHLVGVMQKFLITTHAIEGLSENDFILAAKIDQIFSV